MGKNPKIEPTPALYAYNAQVTRVVDGDTFKATVDLGFGVFFSLTVRIIGVDTPEMKGGTMTAGLAAKSAIEGRFRLAGNRVKIQSIKWDSFGRALCRVWLPDDENVGAWLVAKGLAVESWP